MGRGSGVVELGAGEIKMQRGLQNGLVVLQIDQLDRTAHLLQILGNLLGQVPAVKVVCTRFCHLLECLRQLWEAVQIAITGDFILCVQKGFRKPRLYHQLGRFGPGVVDLTLCDGVAMGGVMNRTF